MLRKRKTGSCYGYLTVYLTLVMTVLISLCLTLIEGTRSNAIRVEAECVTEIGLNSILAEYHRELLAQFNLFAIDSSYGTSATGVEAVTQHLREYLERNLSLEDVFLSDYLYRDFLAITVDSVELKGASILTDENGTVFRRRAVEAMKDDCNLVLLQDLQQWLQVIEDNGLAERDVAAEKQAVDEQLQAYNGREIQIAEDVWSTVEVQNPTSELEDIRKKGILEYVVENADELSTKSLQTEDVISQRIAQNRVNCGNLLTDTLTGQKTLTERFFFQEYLLRYLGHYDAEKEAGAMDYQVEYLLANKNSDIANLKWVVNVICAIREAANAVYLFSDTEKCMEAEVVATVLTALLQVPELAALLKTALLLGWAYAESLYDVEMLLSGGRVPLIKDKSSWHYDIESALHFGKNSDKTSSGGLSYEDYLRVLMMFTDIDALTCRAMDMVEADIRITPGNSYFRLDNCYDQVVFCIRVKSKYGYQYELSRSKKY